MTSVPKGWRVASLGDVAYWGSGGTPRSGSTRYYSGEIPWAVIGDLTDGSVTSTASTITEQGLRESSAKMVPKGAVLVAMYGSIGKLGIAQVPLATNQAIAFAVPREDVVVGKYLFLYLLWQRADLTRAGKGATQQNIGQGTLKSWPIPLPALEEQQRIVGILDDHLSRLEAAEQYLERVLSKSQWMHGAVLQAAIAAKLTSTDQIRAPSRAELLAKRVASCPPRMIRGRPLPVSAPDVAVPWPERWPTMSLEEVTDPVRTISYGILKPGPHLEDGVPYVRVVNMRGDVIDIDGLRRTAPDIARQYARASLQVDDVLISIRGTYGRVAIVPASLAGANITQDTARLAFLPAVLPSFADIVLRAPFIQQFLKRVARGVAVKGVNIGDLRTLPFPVPSLAEQAEIVSRTAEALSDLLASEVAAGAARRRSKSLRRALLSAAFNGRLTGLPAMAARAEPAGHEELTSV